MKTVCHKQLGFKSFGKEIIACFDGGWMTSDGGGLLLREIDERYGVTKAAVPVLKRLIKKAEKGLPALGNQSLYIGRTMVHPICVPWYGQ